MCICCKTMYNFLWQQAPFLYSRCLFLSGCICMILAMFARLACDYYTEDILCIWIMLCVGNYFLFFMR